VTRVKRIEEEKEEITHCKNCSAKLRWDWKETVIFCPNGCTDEEMFGDKERR